MNLQQLHYRQQKASVVKLQLAATGLIFLLWKFLFVIVQISNSIENRQRYKRRTKYVENGKKKQPIKSANACRQGRCTMNLEDTETSEMQAKYHQSCSTGYLSKNFRYLEAMYLTAEYLYSNHKYIYTQTCFEYKS